MSNTREIERDRIRGCMVGGAVGDALGYPVEFMFEEEILDEYGAGGIRTYRLRGAEQKALISDDTQMALFTANGVLAARTRAALCGDNRPLPQFIAMAYQDWLRTQDLPFENGRRRDVYGEPVSWLLDVPELFFHRAPGNTCLYGLRVRQEKPAPESYIEPPLNSSKGNGTVMRIAPMGLYRSDAAILELDEAAAEASAVTHGHPLGYMTSAMLTHIIHRIVYPEESLTLREIIQQALDTMGDLYNAADAPREHSYLGALNELMQKAMDLSGNAESDHDNIKALGGGWVAEEALAIAIYCALRYENDFSAGVIASVNHSGDSDSTGAIAGNILGAWLGYEAIEEKWKTYLEILDVILELSDDLWRDGTEAYATPAWQHKYMEGCR